MSFSELFLPLRKPLTAVLNSWMCKISTLKLFPRPSWKNLKTHWVLNHSSIWLSNHSVFFQGWRGGKDQGWEAAASRRKPGSQHKLWTVWLLLQTQFYWNCWRGRNHAARSHHLHQPEASSRLKLIWVDRLWWTGSLAPPLVSWLPPPSKVFLWALQQMDTRDKDLGDIPPGAWLHHLSWRLFFFMGVPQKHIHVITSNYFADIDPNLFWSKNLSWLFMAVQTLP